MLTPRWPQLPVVPRFKEPNYHYLIAKENKLKLGQVEVGSKIAQNQSSSIQGVIIDRVPFYLPQFT